jgi:hypothetical protein
VKCGVLVIVFPQVSEIRLSITPSGPIRYLLKTLYSDGITHVIFVPLDFIPMLAADVSNCPKRGGETKVIASIDDQVVIDKILQHLHIIATT